MLLDLPYHEQKRKKKEKAKGCSSVSLAASARFLERSILTLDPFYSLDLFGDALSVLQLYMWWAPHVCCFLGSSDHSFAFPFLCFSIWSWGVPTPGAQVPRFEDFLPCCSYSLVFFFHVFALLFGWFWSIAAVLWSCSCSSSKLIPFSVHEISLVDMMFGFIQLDPGHSVRLCSFVCSL